jgi:hypothetical protein
MNKHIAASRPDRRKTTLYAYHLRQIQEGLTQARAGMLIDYEKVKADWKKRLAQSSATSHR